MIKVSIIDKDSCYLPWWRNFDDYHEPLWDISIGGQLHRTVFRWEIYVNNILKDIGVLNFAPEYTISFYTPEDYITFVLRWS